MATTIRPAGDVQVIGLITVAHFFSHLYILALPPLFPVLAADLGLSATQLGLAVASMNVTTAVLQAPTGGIVDRYGSARILAAGQALFALSFVLIAAAPGLVMLFVAMLLAGIGNSVYHPADYAVLAGRIEERRAGRAFAVHTFGGYAGFAAAPPLMVGLHALAGWRTALFAIGIAGLLYAAFLYARRGDLEPPARPAVERPAAVDKWALVRSPPILLGFLFFAAIAMAQTGISSFGVLALERLGADLAGATAMVTAFLVTSALGVLAGGWVADRIRAHDRFVMAASLACAAFTLAAGLVAAWTLAGLDPTLTTLILMLLLSAAGLASGVIAPSRDMIVRKLAPEGQTGTVFGFVTTGFNLGGLVAPPLFGLAIDYGAPTAVFYLSAFFSLSVIVTLGVRARGTVQTPV
ncbi:MAG: MFS transporter [Geminicoccaceae bacterium]|nr:MFS transporter [Geminicoccaceae bacterium]